MQQSGVCQRKITMIDCHFAVLSGALWIEFKFAIEREQSCQKNKLG